MKINSVQKALKAHFDTLPKPGGGFYVFNWPNQEYDGSPSYIDIDVNFTASSSDDLGGKDVHHTGFVTFVAVVPANVSTEQAFEMFDAVSTRAVKGLRIPVEDGHVLFDGNVEMVASGYQTDSDWRLPFQITFMTS